jgi:zinc transporter 1
MVLGVASAGIIVNIIGMFLFHGHSHAHGHNHEHVPDEEEVESIAYNYDVVRIADKMYSDERSLEHAIEEASHSRTASNESPLNESSPLIRDRTHRESHHDHDGHDHSDGHAHEHSHENSHGHSHADLNMHGLFVHILGDLLASLGVIASTCIIIFVDQPWTIYLDPIMSFVITVIVIGSTIPLVKSASYILLQGTPSSISIERIRKEILKLPNVIDVHELHIWQLSEGQTIGSVHIVVPQTVNHVAFNSEQYMALASIIKKKLHVFMIDVAVWRSCDHDPT